MVFIDTGAFIARHVKRDQHHDAAVVCWEKLDREGLSCFTSNHVLDETVTLLARLCDHGFAAVRARNIFASPRLRVLRPSEREEWAALELLEKYADQRVSYTDCLSFVLMRGNRLQAAFTFDSHFERAGFRLWR